MKTITKLLLALVALMTTLPAAGQLRIPNFGASNDSNEQPHMQSSPNSLRLPSYGAQDSSSTNQPYSDQRDNQRDETGNSPTDRQDPPNSLYGDPAAPRSPRSNDNSSYGIYPRSQ
ncbi:MAG: hypothetical protein EPN46_11830 [Candidimonas sp.]|nr:MAG: hypothetical protein EPN77_16040 [Candidimonas sp.]TAM25182.1 MAG: hypothetical protein EPN62_04735 [Candidimonas sp.]TAM74748.1 MAG: hypothetical protein EPN46_11830 [Candidimonas sp.]